MASLNEFRQLQVSMNLVQQELRLLNRRLSYKAKKLERQIHSSNSSGSLRLKNLIIIIPCLLGCLYQAHQITEVHLKYDVTAESLFYPGDVIVAPMVTICIVDNFKTNCSKSDCQRNSTQYFSAIFSFEQFAEANGLWFPGIGIRWYMIDMDMKSFAKDYVTTYIINGRSCYAIDFAKWFGGNYTFRDVHSNPSSVAFQMKVFAEACRDSTK